MNKKQLLDSIATTFANGVKIVKKKNTDYAKGNDAFSNFRHSELVGVTVEKAILVRICDKIARLGNVLENGTTAVKDESVADTIIDGINYLAILKAYLEDNRKV